MWSKENPSWQRYQEAGIMHAGKIKSGDVLIILSNSNSSQTNDSCPTFPKIVEEDQFDFQECMASMLLGTYDI